MAETKLRGGLKLDPNDPNLGKGTFFPIRPLFDRVIVREIPIEDYYEQGEIKIDLDNAHIKERSDRGVVVAAGKAVQEVQVGDTVQFDEYCMSDPIYLNPADKNKIDLPRYWQIREPDLKGVRVRMPFQYGGVGASEEFVKSHA